MMCLTSASYSTLLIYLPPTTLVDSDSDSEGDRTTTTTTAKGKAAGAPVQQQDGDESADQALSTSEAVKLIRDMLRQASERGKGEDDETVEGEAEGEEKQPTTTTATTTRYCTLTSRVVLSALAVYCRFS